MGRPDALVVGGGLIGLAVAWRCAQRGLAVTVVDPEAGRGASYAAAGMLAPVTEASYGEERLLALNLDSAARYPGFLADLGADVGYEPSGILNVAADTGDRAVHADLHAFQQRLGLASRLVSSREARALEPMLAPTVRGGLLVEGDASVDPRRLTAALLTAAQAAGVTVLPDRVVTAEAGRVTLASGGGMSAGTIVVAAGAASYAVAGLPVRPVKGQILRLRGPRLLTRTVRGLVAGSPVYLVPRADGELVVGATVEERTDPVVTAGGVWELLRDAHALVPGISELELADARAGFRPGSPDNAPLIGTVRDGLVAATGHHRNGVLLTPVTADAVAELLDTGKTLDVVRPFGPERFG